VEGNDLAEFGGMGDMALDDNAAVESRIVDGYPGEGMGEVGQMSVEPEGAFAGEHESEGALPVEFAGDADAGKVIGLEDVPVEAELEIVKGPGLFGALRRHPAKARRGS
jgi:hypothetical protein